ncbi:MAG TPA: ABC transporter ATP-binding protein [Geminicoccaceae bacterium]|nr:ABC transporter ATP-binding protein [Geminicoccaceae bacterium]
MAKVELRQVTKLFGPLKAVDRADLEIADGEVLCLLGPSGCGKTTTLRMIAGLEWATSGDIALGGRRVNDVPTRERNVAMAFQFYALYPNLTVAENLAYPLHAERLGSARIREKVGEVARVLQLVPVLQRRPSQLAEGEKQRVSVGRCIIRDPSCFLFDEPLSRLDVQLREEMRGEIKLVLQGLQRPTIIVTHDQLEALTMADRIAVMRAGIIEQVATPHGIFAKPANLFVAGFIGTPQMNLIPAELEGWGDDGRVRFAVEGGQRLALQVDPAVRGLLAGTKVTLGIRPRNLDVVHEPVDDGLSSVVDIVEPMGAETLAHLNDGRHDIRVVAGWRTPLAEGEKVHVRFQPGQVHVFDPQGKAVRS